MTATSTPTTALHPTRTAATPAAIAPAVYVLAWLVGLAVKPGGPALDAASDNITAHFATHAVAAAVQSVLVHGVAALALAVAAVAIARRADGWVHTSLATAGVTAAVISVGQMAFGLVAASSSEDAATAFGAMNRLDGVKMLVLAAFAAAGVVAARRGALPRWVGWVGVALVVTLVPAAVGYVLLAPALASIAAPALVLLLVFVGGAGHAAGRR